MDIVIGGRRSGRTTKCIKWASKNDAYIVCATESHANEIASQAREMGLVLKYPITWKELPLRGAWPTKIAIDNADQLLRSVVGYQHNLGLITLEGEEVENKKPTVGRIVHYTSRLGDGIVSPAIVLRTRESTNLEVIERWGGDSFDGTLSRRSRPDELVAELPDDFTIDLAVFGLGGDYREYAVTNDPDITTCGSQSPRSWHWPELT